MGFPVGLALPVLNHVLAASDWARVRLRPFTGQGFRIDGGPWPLALEVVDDGFLAEAAPASMPAVTISLGDGVIGDLLSNPQRAFASARLSGAANFAETLAFVFRNLRWDYEADLASIVGDIPARRLAGLLASGLEQQRKALANLGANVAEYLTEEGRMVTPQRDVRAFATGVDSLRDDVARLEKRIAALSR
jgi:ubiquinone biosynthesis accessory factor UbiJ